MTSNVTRTEVDWIRTAYRQGLSVQQIAKNGQFRDRVSVQRIRNIVRHRDDGDCDGETNG